MGWAKEREYELFTRGFGETGDQAVCLECLTDEGLVGEVRDILDEPQCSFCGAKAGDDGAPIAVDFERFMYVVMDGVNFIYGLANDEGVPFDEGDWVGGPVLDSYDVVEDICGYAAKENVVEAIQEVVDHNAWTYRNYQLLQPDRAMRLGWDEFCQRIKHETRFLFMAIPQSPSLMPDEFTSVEFMARLMEIISTSGALVKVPAGRVFWRGRLVGDSKLPRYGAKELGSPPPDKASANRMSPAGISMFYGSDDIETVVAEIGAHGSRSHAAVGSFETTKPLTMLNLAALPAVPSIFTESGRESYYDLRFLHDFGADLRKPVVLDGREHIDYVPTQVVTEYLRWMSPEQVDGILSSSSQNEGTNCVIFCGPEGCVDPDDELDESYLRFNPDSLQVVKVVASPMRLAPRQRD
ncbi:RES domain-containing protein [Micromonospora cremea]|uniref:RES domain-containing protein n=1 Tax=Micromonospora cremea TaxID=709881 RepID=A0A1N5YXI1_9ACTN|nr:RES domain-containing protein [Micromonospora cremea]